MTELLLVGVGLGSNKRFVKLNGDLSIDISSTVKEKFGGRR